MGNETEEREIEGVESETEGVESDNEAADNEVLTPDRKAYRLSNPPMSTKVTKEPIGAPWDGTILLLASMNYTVLQKPMSALVIILPLSSNQHHQPTSSPMGPS